MDRFLFRGVKLARMDKSVKDSKNIVVLPLVSVLKEWRCLNTELRISAIYILMTCVF